MGLFFVLKGEKMEELKTGVKKESSYANFYALLQFDTKKLKSVLKMLGLSFQKVEGLWDNEKIIVWKTTYTFGLFKEIMLIINARFKQKTFCLGREQDKMYDVKVYQTDSLDNIQYQMIDHYCIDARKKDVLIGKKQNNVCLASSNCLMAAYKRDAVIKKLRTFMENNK